MVMRTGGFSNLLAPGFRKVFFDDFKGIGTEYDKVANIGSSTRNYEKDYEMSMLGGTFPTKGEGVSIQYTDPVSGNTKTYTHVTYGLGFRITEEMYEDDLYKTMGGKASKGLAKAAANNLEVRWAGLLDDLNTGTTYTGFDSARCCLYTTGHQILYTGGYYSNAPATAVDLGVTSLQAAITNIEKQPDKDGVIAGLKASKLIIAVDQRFMAKEMLKSEYKPFTANNEINSLKDEGISFIVSHYMADLDMWILLADKHDLNFFWRRKTRFDNSDDFDTGDAKFKASQRYSLGFGDWRGTYGTFGG
jgi:hypothetical protein